jgi:hypothetical protein
MSLDDEELSNFLFYLFIYSCDEPIKLANSRKKKRKKELHLINRTNKI